ncbi:hypothetical protein F4779DRAFT_622770 [Xylariaceae sp. FL0662B]|nr:hypothetical protein F4779DRAFT_622770 [Xylariaceae sp. FL0662B]
MISLLTPIVTPIRPAHLELLWVFSSYIYIFSQHTLRRALPIAKKSFRASRHKLLITHILLSLAEILRYHLQALLHGPPVVPQTTDLALALAHALTSFRLARDRPMGDSVLTRPTHQSLAGARALLAAAAFATGSPFYHTAALRVLGGFVYPRLLIGAAGRLRALPSYRAVYAAAMFVASLLCLCDSAVPLAPHLFLVLFAANLALNRWVAGRIVGLSEGTERRGSDYFVRLLYRAGFAELETLRVGRERMEMVKRGERLGAALDT